MRCAQGVLLLLAGLAVLAAGEGAARANMAAMQIYPARLAPPLSARPTGLEVESEALRVTCEEAAGGGPTCRFEAIYRVHNPGAQAETVVGAFYGARAREVSIVAGGRKADRTLTPEEGQALDEALDATAGEQIRRRQNSLTSTQEKVGRYGFEAAFGAGERGTVEARGVLEPGQRFEPTGYRHAAVESRHLLLGSEGRDRTWDLEYLVAPVWTWAGDPTIEVEVEVRGPYRVLLGDGGWSREERDGAAIARGRWRAKDGPGALQILLTRDAPVLTNGGVLVGVGGAVGDHGGFRARLGYEAAAIGWLLVSAAAETDFQRRFQLVPAVEAASPAFFVLPSVGIGLGLPVQIVPEPRLAGRLQVSAMFFPVGVFAALDYYPRAGSSQDFLEGTVMFQASF